MLQVERLSHLVLPGRQEADCHLVSMVGLDEDTGGAVQKVEVLLQRGELGPAEQVVGSGRDERPGELRQAPARVGGASNQLLQDPAASPGHEVASRPQIDPLPRPLEEELFVSPPCICSTRDREVSDGTLRRRIVLIRNARNTRESHQLDRQMREMLELIDDTPV